MTEPPLPEPAPAPAPAPRSRALPFIAIFLLGAVLGGLAGFGAGVLSVRSARTFLQDALELEQPADVARPRLLERPGFSLQHPGNWKVDTEDRAYDPDANFSLDSPGASFVRIMVASGEADPARVVEAHVTVQLRTILKDAARTPFAGWGSFTGAGVELKGRSMGLVPVTLRIFAFQAGGRTVTILEYRPDEDAPRVQAGFDLVARTFALKPRAGEGTDPLP